MKTIITKSAICIILAILLPSSLNAQTYPDYLFGTTTPQTMNAIIRQYSPTEVVAVYHHYTLTPPLVNYTTISVIDIYGNIHSIDMATGYQVYDMEIVDDYLIMCGRYNASKAFIGCVYIPNILTSSASVNYHVLDGDVSVFRKMVAFEDQNRDTKVVAVGSLRHTLQNPASLLATCQISNYFNPCPAPYVCEVNFIIEATNPQNYPPGDLPFDIRFINDNQGSPDLIDDVLLTDTYVVFLGQGYHSGNTCLTIHPCSKNNVLSDFDNYYYYPTIEEGFTAFIGCHMDKDTIAIVSRGRNLAPGWSEHDTRIRTIDVASKIMTSSQAFDLNDYKSDPQDMVYLPEKHLLVLLEDIISPGTGINNFSFLFLNPYHNFKVNPAGMPIITPPLPWMLPYTASGFYESRYGLTFWSMDRTESDAIVATGGDYWIVKTIPLLTPNHGCYMPVEVDVHKLYDIIGYYDIHSYKNCSYNFLSSSILHASTMSTVAGTCP